MELSLLQWNYPFKVDGNWFEGERNALVGIFPTTYVEIIPSENIVTQEIVSGISSLNIVFFPNF